MGADVVMGPDCGVAMNVSFANSIHRMGGSGRRAGEPFALPITVGDGVWIGANAVIMPGVTIGPGCMVAAGALVNKDCRANGIYAGVPAVRIRELDGRGRQRADTLEWPHEQMRFITSIDIGRQAIWVDTEGGVEGKAA